MIRPYTQSLVYVVSYKVDALALGVGAKGKTAAIRQRKLIYC